MFSKIATRLSGTALTLMLAANIAGVGSASAQSLTGKLVAVDTSTPSQAAISGNISVASGASLAIRGSSYEADEDIGLWLNVPDGMAISNESLGQTDTSVEDNVVAINDIPSADDNGQFTYTLDTSGLPNGSYSLVAHGFASGTEGLVSFTVTGARPFSHLTADGDTSSVAAGSIITLHGAAYGDEEAVGLWLNVPDGTDVADNSLGQPDSYVDGNVIALDAMGSTDDAGSFTYSLDTTGLPAGTYSLVAHGLSSQVNGVAAFTIK